MGRLDFKIFKTNRLGLTQMYEDAVNYMKTVYAANDREFTSASPFAQIINVTINLGRMILFYIENSITELNIRTAYQARSIRGLAELTGHSPSMGVAARGSLYVTYNMSSEYDGDTIYIKNYTRITNGSNVLTYLAILPSNTMQVTVGLYDSHIEIPIIQGELKYQQGTGTGEALQSFNFANKSDVIIDDFFLNVYVNGKRWETVKSILDMGYEQEACIVKTSMNGGIDVFFGTGNNGKIPVLGATILCEYIVCAGDAGNVEMVTDENYWTFADEGYDFNGDYVDLNSIYSLSSASDITFGANGESIEMTRKLAPNASRNFVFATVDNYRTFLARLNKFSIIDVFSGFNTEEDAKIEEEYSDIKVKYNTTKQLYSDQVNLTGISSKAAQDLLIELNETKLKLDSLRIKYEESKMDDNIIYIYLVPDISKRLTAYENYFTCSIDRFRISEDEKDSIIGLINSSGQKVITVDNQIIDPVYVNFAINIFIQMWSTYDFNAVKSDIISQISDYLIKNTRRDRIPVSDFIRIVEGVDGVDSVTIFFDADKNNQNYFGVGNYGIDQYGDIVLNRDLYDRLGNKLNIRDIQPLFRGGFTSPNDVYYDTDVNAIVGPINITLRGKTVKE